MHKITAIILSIDKDIKADILLEGNFMDTSTRKRGLTFYIAIATFVGIIVGWILGESASLLEPLGELFMNLIKMVIVPLVFLSITLGAASLDDVKKAGKIGLQAFSFYMFTTVFAISIAILLGSVLQPGVGLDKEQLAKLAKKTEQKEQAVAQTVNEKKKSEKDQVSLRKMGKNLVRSMLAIIPKNPLKAMTDVNMLQIIFFAIFLGLSLAVLPEEQKDPVLKVLNGLNHAFIKMVNWIMWTAPLGVCGLMAVTVGVYGFTTIYLLIKLLLVYILCAIVHFSMVYGGLLKLMTGLPLLDFVKKMERALLVSFTTASSLVTLPTSMETAEEEFDVEPEVSSFVLPLGATINMDGSAMNFGLYAVFGLQYFGMDLTAEKAILIILTATLGAIGAAGVPGPSVLTISVLIAAGVPLSVLPLYVATDRIFDMIRTSVNISGDITCAAIVNHWNYKKHHPKPKDRFE